MVVLQELHRKECIIMESVILQLYQQVEMYKDNSPEYQKLLGKFNDERDKFDKKLNDADKEELENLFSLLSMANGKEMEEYFVEGFVLGTRLMAEVFYKEDN
jgi:hypothetical protein